MNLDEAIHTLRRMNEPVPKPGRLPTRDEVSAMERQLGVQFHSDYRRFLLEASDVVVGTLEPARITVPESHDYLPDVINTARAYGIPRDPLPICENNGDFFCMCPNGEIVYWSHDGATSESWPDLAKWIMDVWIGESTS